MAAKKFFFPHGSFSIRDGSEIRFWKDKWLGQSSLREQYPALYAIVRNKSDTIAKVLGTSPPNVSFRRRLLGTRQASWNALLIRLDSIQLSDCQDRFRWNLTKNGKLSVDSMYRALILPEIPVDTKDNNKIWKMKIPLKIRCLRGIYVEVSFLQKITLPNVIGTEVKSVFSVNMTRPLHTYSSSANSPGLYGQPSR